jgi:aspartate carbamoyltransferase regulatory subunit
MSDIINLRNSGKTKKDKFTAQQKIIVDKLNEIVGLSNNMLILENVKNNSDVKNKIASLENEVKKYFSCSKWTCINREVNDFETCLLRSIYRDYGYKLVYKPKMTDGKTFTECYLI